MAERLAKKFGTEDDKVNCPFYYKIGACRHGDGCTRQHNKPPLSQTLLFFHLYKNPGAAIAFADGLQVPPEELLAAAEHCEDFFEEVFVEFSKYGEMLDMVVADNIGEHMMGNVYVKFATEEQAEKCFADKNGRYYNMEQIQAEYSPVTDFREAKCRQYNEGACERGGYCNFIHPKHISRDLRQTLTDEMYTEHPGYAEAKKLRIEAGEESDGSEKSVEKKKPRPPPEEQKPKRDDRSRDRERERDRHGRSNHRSREADSRGPRRDERRDRDRRDDRRDDRDRHRERSHRDRDRRDHRDQRSSGRDRDRDHGRSSHGDRRDRDRHHGRRSRSRSGDPTLVKQRSAPSNREREESPPVVRQTSEERRAMIAQWDRDDSLDKNPTHQNPEQIQSTKNLTEQEKREEIIDKTD